MPTTPAAQSIGAGWIALEAGRYKEAVAAANSVLARRPFDHSAIALKIEALALGSDVPGAIRACSEWSSRRQGDPYLMAIVAQAVLQDFARSGAEIAQRVKALETLAAAGDQDAAGSLTQLASSAGVEGQTALAEIGDAAAADRLLRQLRSPNARKAEILHAIGRLDPPNASAAIVPLLTDSSDATRAAAAAALGNLGDPSSAEALISSLNDPMPAVKQAAALSLLRLRRSEGEAIVADMLQLGVPDITLTAAEGMPEQPERWQSAVEPLLASENAEDRLRAARLLKTIKPDAARAVLDNALADANPAVREEAARALEDVALPGTPNDWLKMLTDSSAWVRLEAARALFRTVTR